ncbi:MAG: periplasmic heavy metal sensor [Phycisphaerales bacterium]
MKRTAYVVLVLSLVFNAAVLAGFMSGAGRRPPLHPPPPPEVARALQSLNLSDAQRAAIDAIREETRKAMDAFDDEAQLLDQMLNDELAKDAPSGERIRETLDRQAELQRDRRRTQVDSFERFHAQLTPEQRRTLREELERARTDRPRPDGPPPIRRFDADGDGRLNDSEQRAAREALDARREALHLPPGPRGPLGAREPRPAPLWAYFDRDGDGRLSDAERAERDEFVKTHPISKALPSE